MSSMPLRLAATLTLGLLGAASAARAQTVYLPTLHENLDIQAANALASAPVTPTQPRLTLGHVLSFRVGQVQFAAAPPVRYSVLPGYARVAGTCPGGGGRNTTPSSDPPASPNEPQTGPAPQAVTLLGRRIIDVLPEPPRPPVSAFDYSLSVEIDKTTDLSPMLTGLEDALTAAWANAAVAGRGAVPPSPLSRPLLSGANPPPLSATPFLVLPVTAYYHLEGASYTTQVGLGQFTARPSAAGPEVPAEGPADWPTLSVAGQLSGGRWGQGAGLLFIPNPVGATTTCQRGILSGEITADGLRLNGVSPDGVVTRGDAIFVRYWGNS